MQVPQSSQPVNGQPLQELPAKLSAQLVLGQRLEAVALAAAAKGEQVKVQLGNTVIEITADKAVKEGQKLQLEVVQQAGRLVLQMVNPDEPVRQLQQGMRFNAEVVTIQPQQQLLIAIQDSGGRLPAKMQIDVSTLGRQFQAGQTLQIEVVKLQPLSVVLRPAQIELLSQIRDLQRTLLPLVQDQRLQPVMLNQSLPRAVAAPITAPLNHLLSQVVDRQQLPHANVLRDAIQNSGNFLERQLQNQPQTTGQDFKANLMRLASAIEQQLATAPDRPRTEQLLRQLPAEIRAALTSFLASSPQLKGEGLARLPGNTPILQQIIVQLQQQTSQQTTSRSSADSAVVARAIEASMLRDLLQEVRSLTARVQLNQLAMVRDPDTSSPNQVWLMDLPVKDRQELSLVRMRIQQQQSTSEEQSDTWQVQLNLETVNLGVMQALLTLYQQNVSVTLIAERPETAAILEQHLDSLRQRLQALDLNVGQLNCRCAPVPAIANIPSVDDVSDQPQSYVDIHV